MQCLCRHQNISGKFHIIFDTLQLRKDFHNSLKTKGKVEISLSTEKQKNIKELIHVLNAEMYLTYTKKQYMKSISIHSPKYNEVLLC